MSKDINLVAVCAEKRGRPINQPGQRGRARDTERGNNGQPSGGEPQQLQGPVSQHTLTYTYILFSFSLAVTHTQSFLPLRPGRLKGGQLSRCSTTGFTKGTCEWRRKRKRRETNFCCTVESACTAAIDYCFFCFHLTLLTHYIHVLLCHSYQFYFVVSWRWSAEESLITVR